MDPDFPAIHPIDAEKLIEKTLNLFDAESIVFDRHLQSIVEIIEAELLLQQNVILGNISVQ